MPAISQLAVHHKELREVLRQDKLVVDHFGPLEIISLIKSLLFWLLRRRHFQMRLDYLPLAFADIQLFGVILRMLL